MENLVKEMGEEKSCINIIIPKYKKKKKKNKNKIITAKEPMTNQSRKTTKYI